MSGSQKEACWACMVHKDQFRGFSTRIRKREGFLSVIRDEVLMKYHKGFSATSCSGRFLKELYLLGDIESVENFGKNL